MKPARTFLVLSVLLLNACGSSLKPLSILTPNGDVKLQVDVVHTEEEKLIGLMGREKLKDGTGMLFLYPDDAHPSMWMKGVLIPLDILFIGSDGRINHIENNVPPCMAKEDRECPVYQSDERSAFVLELPAGFTDDNKIEEGDRIFYKGL